MTVQWAEESVPTWSWHCEGLLCCLFSGKYNVLWIRSLTAETSSLSREKRERQLLGILNRQYESPSSLRGTWNASSQHITCQQPFDFFLHLYCTHPHSTAAGDFQTLGHNPVFSTGWWTPFSPAAHPSRCRSSDWSWRKLGRGCSFLLCMHRGLQKASVEIWLLICTENANW